MQAQFHGIIAYPVTPFAADGSPALEQLSKLIDKLVADGVHAIAPLGSTGESAYLSDEEWDAVAATALASVAKRLPVVVSISDLTTRNAIRRAQFAERHGADAVMVLPVAYWKLSADEIFAHYAAIAQAISIPIMLYNNPGTTGIDMPPELIVRIVKEIDNVTMVKESSGDIQRMNRLMQLGRGEIAFYNGSNPLAFAALTAGATGWCTAAPNLHAALPLALYRAVQDGDLAAARACFLRQLPLLQFIVKGGLPTTVKAGLRLLDFDAGLPRLPLQALPAAAEQELRQILAALPA